MTFAWNLPVCTNDIFWKLKWKNFNCASDHYCLCPVYTTGNFWHDLGEIGKGARKKGSAQIKLAHARFHPCWAKIFIRARNFGKVVRARVKMVRVVKKWHGSDRMGSVNSLTDQTMADGSLRKSLRRSWEEEYVKELWKRKRSYIPVTLPEQAKKLRTRDKHKVTSKSKQNETVTKTRRDEHSWTLNFE